MHLPDNHDRHGQEAWDAGMAERSTYWLESVCAALVLLWWLLWWLFW